jgi:hypothetical protein
MKVHWHERGGRILLGDNTGGEALILRPIRLHCVWVWFSTGILYIYIYMYMHMYLTIRLIISELRRIWIPPVFPEQEYYVIRGCLICAFWPCCLIAWTDPVYETSYSLPKTRRQTKWKNTVTLNFRPQDYGALSASEIVWRVRLHSASTSSTISELCSKVTSPLTVSLSPHCVVL